MSLSLGLSTVFLRSYVFIVFYWTFCQNVGIIFLSRGSAFTGVSVQTSSHKPAAFERDPLSSRQLPLLLIPCSWFQGFLGSAVSPSLSDLAPSAPPPPDQAHGNGALSSRSGSEAFTSPNPTRSLGLELWLIHFALEGACGESKVTALLQVTQPHRHPWTSPSRPLPGPTTTWGPAPTNPGSFFHPPRLSSSTAPCGGFFLESISPSSTALFCHETSFLCLHLAFFTRF